ncbi:hypothetical protein [Natrinema ejinorense]|uniref:hypothetical protein n=1 Tax=Natrinema ejinorense TaxID=373386 RepID=UPI00118019FE|nr:hypothetical protein [Natrinema ejinorense]
MTSPPFRDRSRIRAGAAIGLLWLLSTVYGFIGPGSLLLFSILPLVLVGSVVLLSLFYRLVVAIEHIAYES